MMRNSQKLRNTVSRMVRTGAALGISAALMFAAACGSSSATASTSSKASADSTSTEQVNVAVSVNQWKSLAEQIGGDKVSVSAILSNQNVEAHDFEPQPSDIAKISKAKIVVANGADYDPWATKAAANANVTVVNAADAAGIEEGANPHIWFSAEVRKAAAKSYVEQLKKADAADANYFDAQYKKWEQSESKLESAITEAKKTTKGLTYAATESVAYYLAEDLGMKDATPTGYAQATTNESEPSPGDISAFQKQLAAGSIDVLVLNEQETNSTTDMISKSAEKAGVPIVRLTESMPEDYTDLTAWVKSLVNDFSDAAQK